MRAKAGRIIKAHGGSESFELLDLISEGRTGEVYTVRDTRDEDEQWPLKLRLAAVTGQLADNYVLKISRPTPDQELSQRNQRIACEQYALERLIHPGIVRAGTLGWHQGRAFFAMEQLEGPNLTEFLRTRRRLRYRDSMRLFLKLTQAVSECHELGIIHRDLRPSNIIIEPDRGPVLIDFESCETRPREELSTLGVGAAEYAPPEYLAYVLDPVAIYVNHPRADVYPLGVILHLLLTGRLHMREPWLDLTDYLRKLRDAQPEPLEQLNPDVPPACAALALRLLGKDRPDARDLPRLVADAMEQDEDALYLQAPRFQADKETLLSTIRIAPRRAVGARRMVPRWEAGRVFLQRHAGQVALAALVLAVGATLRDSAQADTNGHAEAVGERPADNNSALTEHNPPAPGSPPKVPDENPAPNITFEHLLHEHALQKSEKAPERIAAEASRPLKVPAKPFKWQKKGPCDEASYEVLLNGACYIEVGVAPCRANSVEHGGRCYRAIADEDSTPVSQDIPLGK